MAFHSCTIPGHGVHTWPAVGALTICAGERYCQYCTSDAAVFKYSQATTLRSHVYRTHTDGKSPTHGGVDLKMMREWAKARKGQNPHSIRDPALVVSEDDNGQHEQGEGEDECAGSEAEEDDDEELPTATPAPASAPPEEITSSARSHTSRPTSHPFTSNTTRTGPSAHDGSPSARGCGRFHRKKSSTFAQTPSTSFSNTASGSGTEVRAKPHGKITKAGQAARLKKMAEKRKAKKDVEAERIKATAAAFVDTVDRIPADGEGEGLDAGDEEAVEEERPRKRSKLALKGSGETDVVVEQQGRESGEVEEDQEGDEEDEDLEMEEDE